MAGLVSFLHFRQIIGVWQLSKSQKRAASLDSTARDLRNWESLLQVPSLLHLSSRKSRSRDDNSDISRSLQAEIRETLIKETNAGHIRKIYIHEKGPLVLRGQLSSSAKRTAPLCYLNRLTQCAELLHFLPTLKA